IRKRTPAISFAIAWKAPPRTRSVIGSTSTRSRVGGPGRLPTSYSITDMSDLQCLGRLEGFGPRGAAGGDDDVPEAVDRRREARRDRGRRVVLVHDRRPLEPVARLEGRAVVVAGGHLVELSADAEPRGPLVAEGLLGRRLLPTPGVSRLERGHEPDPADADVRDLDIRLVEAT